jgi:rod shape-determining protein MreC
MAWRPARIALAVALGAAMLLLLADLRGVAPTRALRGAVGAISGPVEEALAGIGRGIGQRVGGSAEERARIAQLEAELTEARAAAAAAAAGQLDASQAREVAAGMPATGYRQVAARIVATATPQDQVRSVTISAGSAQGVAPGLAVVSAGGLAGVVDSVSPGVATVRLVVDPATELPARIAASAERGVARGSGADLALTPLDPLAAMAVGDLVATVGTADGAIPADLPIGRIETITGSAAELSRRAVVAPGVDPATLDHVVVLVPEGAG